MVFVSFLFYVTWFVASRSIIRHVNGCASTVLSDMSTSELNDNTGATAFMVTCGLVFTIHCHRILIVDADYVGEQWQDTRDGYFERP